MSFFNGFSNELAKAASAPYGKISKKSVRSIEYLVERIMAQEKKLKRKPIAK